MGTMLELFHTSTCLLIIVKTIMAILGDRIDYFRKIENIFIANV